MILVDTSVWIDHLRQSDRHLQELLSGFEILSHPMVIGELACGHLAHRDRVLAALSDLPSAREASHTEVLLLIDRHGLAGTGLGYLDAHLVTSTLITPGARLWTLDKVLDRVARQLGVSAMGP